MTTMTEPESAAVGVSDGAASVAERLLRSTVLVKSRWGGGSGVIWDQDGLIVTNSHVLRDDDASVVLHDDARLEARVVARAPEKDLAALRVERQGLPAAAIGDSSRVRVGQVVLAAGNPLGLRGVVTAGILTGAGQVLEDERMRLDDLLQADVSLAPGNSGGPLADVEGRVLGINSMISGSGVALAIPSQRVQEWITPEVYGQAYLGVRAVPITTRSSNGERPALLLLSVEEGSPADRSGHVQGDVLVGLDGEDIPSAEGLRARLRTVNSGDPVTLNILRGGEPREFVAVPSTRAKASGAGSAAKVAA